MTKNEKSLVAEALFRTLMASDKAFAFKKEGSQIEALISAETAIDDEGDNIIGRVLMNLETGVTEGSFPGGRTDGEKFMEALKINLKTAAFVSSISEEILSGKARKQQREAQEKRETTH